MKQKFQSLDVAAIVVELRERLTGLRLQNVYDASAKIFLLKFARTDVKEIVLVESGIRLHLTEYARDKGGQPGGFCMKLRRHLRTKRLTDVRQLGMDRVVDFVFGKGENAYHLLCEFYASGNVLLCDHEYTILSLLRVVSPDEHTRFAVGERYNVEAARQFQPTTAERLCEVLETGIAAHGKDQLKKFLGARLDHPPALIEHCFRVAEFPPTAKVNALLRQGDGGSYVDEEKVKALAVMLQPGDDIIKKVLTGEDLHGYIILETAPAKAANEQADTNGEVFTDFSPVLYTQHGTAHREYPSFNRAVDEYFYAIESHKMESTQRKQDESASRRLAAVKQEQESRIEGLIATQATTVRKAQLVELNLEQVEQALLVIRSALAAGMDWVDLQKLIKEEQAQRNPVAMLIDGLKLETNQITLLLREPDYAAEFGFEDESDADDDGAVVAENGGVSNSRDRRSEVVKVDVDLSLSAYANARAYFDMKRSAVDKQQRTEKAVSKALKSTERQIKEEQAKTPAYAPPAITRMRKPFWFEKYHWFISTENHLVIGGRDAQQNEMLVKKYLRKGDVYIHADLPGSSSVIVKNPAGSPISPVTLSQAGTMAICHSRAWDAKIVTSAWWVYHDQVSKTAPTGEYLTTGSFMIRGKKNFLPPSQLVYGFGLLFRVADECIGRHLHERRPDLRGGDDSADSSAMVSVESMREPPALEGTTQREQKMGVTPEDAPAEAHLEDELVPRSKIVKTVRSPTDDTASIMTSAADKYELETYEEERGIVEETLLPSLETVHDGTVDGKASEVTRRKYLSAKERRRAKRGLVEDSSQVESPLSNGIESVSPAKVPVQPPPKPIRGKKKKMQKAKEKYGDQDEEERRLRMELLQSAGKPGKKDEEKVVVVEHSVAEKVPKRSQEEKLAEKMGTVLHVDDDAENMQGPDMDDEDDAEAALDVGIDDDDDNEGDRAEIKRMLEEENVAAVEQDDVENLSYLDSLTGQPHADDILLAAIPVSAPFQVLQTYKHRVKLLPGALKKGKATKTVQHALLASKDMSATERELVRAIPEAELMNALLSKVKVMAQGDGGNGGKGKGKSSKGRK